MQPLPGLTCRELVELVTDYLEDALSPRDAARFERHLSNCPGCGVHLDQMRQTLAAFGRLDEDTLEPAVIDPLLEAFRSWSRDEPAGEA
jgi:anti-sigma factor RsiW